MFKNEKLVTTGQVTSNGGVEGKMADLRWVQAKCLWDKGFGRKRFGSPVDHEDFESYLATIPAIPASLVVHDTEFPLLTLIDPRLGLEGSCKRIGITFKDFGHSNASVIPCDDRHTTPGQPFWVRCHDGGRNRNRTPNDCRQECIGGVYAMTAMVAIHVYLHHPGIIKSCEYILDCPGSISAKRPTIHCVSLGTWGVDAQLGICRYVFAPHQGCGSGGFRLE